jgi:hypothetical protein
MHTLGLESPGRFWKAYMASRMPYHIFVTAWHGRPITPEDNGIICFEMARLARKIEKLTELIK